MIEYIISTPADEIIVVILASIGIIAGLLIAGYLMLIFLAGFIDFDPY